MTDIRGRRLNPWKTKPNIVLRNVANASRSKLLTSTPLSAYGTGLVNVYSQMIDGNGDFYNTLPTSVFYDLYQSIVSLSEKSFRVVKEQVDACGINKPTTISAVYVSDNLVADEDFGYWKTVTWRQKSSQSRIVVALKVANSESELFIAA